MTKLRKSYSLFSSTIDKKDPEAILFGYSKKVMDLKRPKLVEEGIPYELLAAEHICSDDEVPLYRAREVITLRNDQR
jgi:hypothetical protein